MKKRIVRFVGSFLLGVTLSAPIVASAAVGDSACLRACLRLGFTRVLCARICLL
jgi:hypothetical protein